MKIKQSKKTIVFNTFPNASESEIKDSSKRLPGTQELHKICEKEV